jgi:glycine cleavage system aminomethyltransferase T
VRRTLVALALADPARFLYHNEPIWRNGALVGRIASGMFGHTVGTSLGLGYISAGGAPIDADWIRAGEYEVEVAAERVAARVSLRPFYDPSSARVRS